jgi:hypothetical protein
MAEITNVLIEVDNQFIAQADSGEIAPPPAPPLTVKDVTWANNPTTSGQYLSKTCKVTAKSAGKDFSGTYKIDGIDGNYKRIFLTPV